MRSTLHGICIAAATVPLGLADQDIVPPAVTQLFLASDPSPGDTYRQGTRIKVGVVFSEELVVSGSPELALRIGQTPRFASLGYRFSVDGIDSGLGFEYIVNEFDSDPDGISIAADALSLNEGLIGDSSGNNAQLSLDGLAIEDYPGHKVDGTLKPAHNIILRVVRVTPDWHGYDIPNGGGWPAAVESRESEYLKYFEGAIWEERKAIHFYEFGNDFNPNSAPSSGSLTATRESYAVAKFEGLPEASYEVEGWGRRSAFIRQAFDTFTAYLVSRYPDSVHHLMYSGHGGPGGLLFAAQMLAEDANKMLANWTSLLGRPLGVVDMGGPCTKGSFLDLENFCPFASYYVASDLPNGGYTFDQWTIEKYHETNPESQYHTLFAESSSLRDALIGRIDLRRKAYEYSRMNMVDSGTKQANYLYSCKDFGRFGPNFRRFLEQVKDASYTINDDLLRFSLKHGASHELIHGFLEVIDHRADNKDFFPWDENRYGMLMPAN